MNMEHHDTLHTLKLFLGCKYVLLRVVTIAMDFSCPLRPYLLAIPAYTPSGPIDESVYTQRAVMLKA